MEPKEEKRKKARNTGYVRTYCLSCKGEAYPTAFEICQPSIRIILCRSYLSCVPLPVGFRKTSCLEVQESLRGGRASEEDEKSDEPEEEAGEESDESCAVFKQFPNG